MKNLEKQFKTLLAENPGWSSYVAFACAVNGQGYSDELILSAFNKLVEKGDYVPSQKRFLLKQLREQTVKN